MASSGSTEQFPVLMTPSAGTILATYNCTARCEHCCFDSHPGIKQRLSLEEIKSAIDQMCETGSLRLIVFSGGECFTLGEDLDRAVEHAAQKGLMTRCVTNGFWAGTPEKARRRLSDLKLAGLKEINFSTGDFHQRWVPQANIINGVLAALELELTCLVVIEMQKERRVNTQSFIAEPRITELLATERGNQLRIIESPWMPMSPQEMIRQNDPYTLSSQNLHLKSGCTSILGTVVVNPHGQLGICCGLSREMIPELNMDIGPHESITDRCREASSDFLKIWLRVEGPERILAWAASKDPTIEWENRYSHHCHACLALFSDEKVRKVIRLHHQEKIPEVLLKFSLMLRGGKVNPVFSIYG